MCDGCFAKLKKVAGGKVVEKEWRWHEPCHVCKRWAYVHFIDMPYKRVRDLMGVYRALTPPVR